MTSMPHDQKRISDLKSVISNTVRVAEELRGRNMAQPRPGSEAAAELAEEKDFAIESEKRPVLDCYSVANLRLIAADDELRSVARIMTDPLPAYAAAALLRTVMEVSSKAWWAYERGIGTRLRVIRGYVDRVTSLIETSRIRVGEKADKEELVRAKSLERLAIVQGSAEAQGFAVKFDKRGGLLHIANEPAPRQTELIRQQLGYTGEAAYRMLSGIAHGVMFGLLWRTQPVEDGGFEGGQYRTPVLEFSDLLRDVAFALTSYRDAIDRQLGLFGWDRTEWEACRVEVNRVMAPLFREEA